MITLVHGIGHRALYHNDAYLDDISDTIESTPCSVSIALYLFGDEQPNHPMPVTMDDADKATNYIFLQLCPHSKQYPCLICIEHFMDNIDLDYLYQD